MNSYFRVDVNLVTVVTLIMVGLIAFFRLDRREKLNKAFFVTTLIIIVQLIIETLTCLINGNPLPWLGPVSVFLHIILFLTAPFLTLYWYLLFRRMIIPNDRVSSTTALILIVPQIFNAVLVFLSPSLGLSFSIDAQNVYHRGPWFLVNSAVTYLYMALAIALIMKNSRKIVRSDLFLMVLGTILPVAGGILQTLFYGSLLMWSSVGISLIILYMFLQQRLDHLDGLTGVWNRESYDYYINQRLRLRPADAFGAIYFDLDQLKEINDRFGHFEGDAALREFARIMRETIRPGDVVARLGGDEFIVIADVTAKTDLERIHREIRSRLSAYNETSGKEYRIETSSGAALFDSSFPSISHFVRSIDQLMYQEKRRKRAEKEKGPDEVDPKVKTHEE
ncbi:MAG TPA: diguanylate cyclase [Candidatus Izemoplasmatales bacterium]|nr:diguanylate cyclase [Candidatus Izemoplasmatales bacterium]